VESAPLFNAATIKDTAVAITDLDTYLAYTPGRLLDHKVKAGDPVPSGTLVDRAVRSGEKQVAMVGKELFGFPYVGTALPVKDERGQVIGCIFFGENTHEQETLREMSHELTLNVTEVNDATQDINAKMEELSALSQELTGLMTHFNENLKGIEGITAVIENIAKKTNMLGINAAIEAARIGEAGRGFAVVSSEISTLSKQSHESVASITEKTKSIDGDAKRVQSEVEQIESISGNISEILNQIAGSLQGINAMVEELSSMADQMIDSE
jgi:uncharacterized protein YoxC